MTLVERLRERADAYYGSQHEELRRVLAMAIARIEAAEADRDEAVALTWAHANNDEHATDRCPICAGEVRGKAVSIDKLPATETEFGALAREQDKEGTDD